MEAAERTAQERTRERDVEIPELLGNQLTTIGEHALAIGEAEVGLELHGAPAHLFAGDVLLAVLEEREGLQLADVELRWSNVLDDLPLLRVALLIRVLGDEVKGVDERRRRSADRLEPPLSDCLKRSEQTIRIVRVLVLTELPSDLAQLPKRCLCLIASENVSHDNFLSKWLILASALCANKYLPC